jgi:hypothetical protein
MAWLAAIGIRFLYAIPILLALWYFWCVAFTFTGNDVLFVGAILVGWLTATLKQSPRKWRAISCIAFSFLITIASVAVIQATSKPARMYMLKK